MHTENSFYNGCTIDRFRKRFPLLCEHAERDSLTAFKAWLSDYAAASPHKRAAEHLQRLIRYDGTTIFELSTERQAPIRTVELLREALRGDETAAGEDLLADLFRQFVRLEKGDAAPVSETALRKRMQHWATGTDETVQRIREANKRRIVAQLVRRVEKRNDPRFPYRFPEGADEARKTELVERWWNDRRFQLAMAIKSPLGLNRHLGGTLDEKTMKTLTEAQRKGIPFFITPYYLSLLDTSGEGYDDRTIRSYVLYSEELTETYGRIRAWEREDRVEPGKPNAAGWLLPEGRNIHRRYPEVAILIPDSMGRACGGLCASCQRMYDFQSKRFHFDLQALLPKEGWDRKLQRLMAYFENDTQLRDILITGGDALMSRNDTLRNILNAVCRMARRKQAANRLRPAGEKYAPLQRVRLGSRLPAYLPMRIDEELVTILREFREQAEQAGVRQFILQTHFQSPLEVTPEALRAIERIQSAGWIVTNQLVYNVTASRLGHTARLHQTLNCAGVLSYYNFTVKGFRENYRVFAPNARSAQSRTEEKRYGRLSEEQRQELCGLLDEPGWNGRKMQAFLKRHKLPFAATGRNVLNLPGIGKSMSFETVGMDEAGRRILKFTHDHSRRHSPTVERMSELYIIENKSIAAYLRQLEELGENPDWYRTIWEYTESETEPRFPFYEYPETEERLTSRFSNLEAV